MSYGKLKAKHMMICPICGIDFWTDNPNAKYCGIDCAEQGRKKVKRKYYGQKELTTKKDVEIEKEFRQKAEEKRKRRAKKSKYSVEEIAVMARQVHMSYGQFVALHHDDMGL